MRARPVDGMTSSQAMQQEFVWSDRRQVGRWRAFWRVIGYSLGTPSRIGNTMTQKRDLRGALWFSFLCLISTTLNLILFFLIGFLMAIFGGSRSPAPFASAAMFTTVLGVLAFSVVVVIGQQLLFIAWGLITHALIRITGRSHHALGHTLSATQYCAGTFIVSAIPLCGFYLSLISLVWMAVAMVSALAALHKISRWRTAFAVLAPLVVIVSVSVWFIYAMFVEAFGFINNSTTPMNFPPMPTNSLPIVAPNTPTTTPSSAPTDATEVETDPATTSTTSQPIDAPTKNSNPVITDPPPTPTQDPTATIAPKKTSNDSAAILNITHGI
jgi:MFS family permease